MPMEKIKQSLSDVVHHWTIIAMITLFLFSVQPGPQGAQALTPELQIKQQAQLKTQILERYSNTVYKPSEKLTDKELKHLLSTVGFKGNALRKAWAIAKRESQGRPMAYNGNRKTGDSSYGLFQINMLGQLGIDRKEKFNLKSNVLLFDPVINAEITYYMTDGGTNWSAWKGINQPAQVYYQAYLKVKS
jgi:hypothetical protein